MARLVAGVVVAALLVLPAGAAGDGRYIAIGDSIAAAPDSYVVRYAARLRELEGIDDLVLRTSGSTSGEVLTGVLPDVLASIADRTDTRVVTVQVGGHDYLRRLCRSGWSHPTCEFADNVAALLDRLRDALAADPGTERLLLVAYYNVASGRGGDEEQRFDLGLRGRDGVVDGRAWGPDWGMTDVLGWLACRHEATLVDPWQAFKAGGQSLMRDELHPNSEGQQLLADLVADPSGGGPTPTCDLTEAPATTLPDAADGEARGIVEPRLAGARWWFEYGTTTDYGRSTPVEELRASAGARQVQAPLPAGTHHVRLVTENTVGRSFGEDQVVRGLEPLRLSAALRTGQHRRRLLRRGVALRIDTNATTVTVVGRLRLRGRDRTVIRDERTWTPGGARTVRYPLDPSARRLMRRVTAPHLVLRVRASRGTDAVRAPRLHLRPG